MHEHRLHRLEVSGFTAVQAEEISRLHAAISCNAMRVTRRDMMSLERMEQDMSDSVTLDLPPEVARRARAVAAATKRRFEDVVVDWIGKVAAEPPVESLSDAEVLDLATGQLTAFDQSALSDLLGRQDELTVAEQAHLDQLLELYRTGMRNKARALREAVGRGLIPRLNGDAA
jgi:hypothetical protein